MCDGGWEATQERQRRRFLDESDRILDEVEELRLHDGRSLPDRLRREIEALQVRIGRSDTPASPSTLRAAHEIVLGVQARLMAVNPRNRIAAAHHNRAQGQALTQLLEGGASWKLLVLPPPAALEMSEWRSLIQLTVERAADRWAYAQHHAIAACRERSAAGGALARARIAWANYWELRQEAERLVEDTLTHT
jgi:hypothetical protein